MCPSPPPSFFPFTSKRLTYRAAEPNETDKTFLHTQILNDPTIQTMSSGRLRRPLSTRSAEDFLKTIQESLLGVIICLPAPAPESNSHNGKNKNKDEKGEEKEKEPIPIGHLTIFRPLQPQGTETDHSRCGTLGISLAAGYRGQGYGSEAINWALDWAFGAAGLHRVNLGAFSYNEGALRCYRNLGFVEEGREREVVYRDRRWFDAVLFSMLESEWEALRMRKRDVE
ncbi:GNAT family N-acetyltransferase [Aspergillus stella-maris]|uniref:GNAT family N-acetyltransferase n=1 Tax=Aspergillus stella-maris TaxID=1810926 RepID=UPI003CCDD709